VTYYDAIFVTTKTNNNTTMAYVISDACVSCGTCVGECPNEAIHEGPDHYVIDPNKCVDCGSCASVCPTDSITPAE
jgi:ferredoxin